jgi:hypothetical protein
VVWKVVREHPQEREQVKHGAPWKMARPRLYLFFAFAAFASACGSLPNSGLAESDPHLVGPRDLNYDHAIVPGQRIGPAEVSGTVGDVVQKLGNPDRLHRGIYGDPTVVRYIYETNDCIWFDWSDSGVDPKINGSGVHTDCAKFHTRTGIRVGMPLREALKLLPSEGIYHWCEHTGSEGSLAIIAREGLELDAKNRNSVVSQITVEESKPAFAQMSPGLDGCD